MIRAAAERAKDRDRKRSNHYVAALEGEDDRATRFTPSPTMSSSN